jgi:phosphoglycolate phosphatase-like HAD superfamily hydrolase
LKQKVSLIITDLDNTLFDWVEIWYRSFSAMLESLLRKSQIPRQTLVSEIREIHQREGTSEYAFLIEELPSLREKHPGQNPAEVYADAIQAFREARASALTLYPTVSDTLQFLKASGCQVVGYTESLEFYSLYRVRKLNLDGLLDFVYTPPDHALPSGLSREKIRLYAPESYALTRTQHRHTPPGELKPNPKLLADIIIETGGRKSESIYIGDSLMKDIAMAQDAGVTDVHAKYGTAQNRPEYGLLREVTHWTPEAVQKEKELTRSDVKPKYELQHHFSEIKDLFDFQPFAKASSG